MEGSAPAFVLPSFQNEKRTRRMSLMWASMSGGFGVADQAATLSPKSG
jgi:hypothetical protein